MDLSRVAFRVGGGTKVSDLLHALPFVKGAPILGAPSANLDMRIDVARALDGLPTVSPYDLITNPSDTAKQLDAAQSFPVSRLGGRAKVLIIDQVATPAWTAQNYATYNLQVAAAAVLSRLDTMFARGTGTGTPVEFKGLAALSAESGRSTAATANLEKDVSNALMQVTPTDGNAGDGPHCLIGGPRMLRKLMDTSSGTQGLSGWSTDPRTGRRVYKYMGLPYYRTNPDEDTDDKAPLYAANLGPTGLCLVHAYGARETFGLEVQETDSSTASGAREITVHGAWALVSWEQEALFEVQGISVAGY